MFEFIHKKLFRFIGFLTLIISTVIINMGCFRDIVQPEPATPANSLLFIAPFIGDESEIRSLAPQPERLTRFGYSVEGFSIPVESKLRFPIELRDGARLSFRLGAQTTVSIRQGDLEFRIEWFPEKPIIGETGEKLEKVIAYSTIPERNPEIFTDWFFADIPLYSCGTGKGELCFIVDGPLAYDPDVSFFLGHPSVYFEPELKHRN
ncbi:MAG TPA: hypothetical protein ENN67_04440, partial [Firmicutes bacterium]|nr:hypothetical protein [Bacillota bacterium]